MVLFELYRLCHELIQHQHEKILLFFTNSLFAQGHAYKIKEKGASKKTHLFCI